MAKAIEFKMVFLRILRIYFFLIEGNYIRSDSGKMSYQNLMIMGKVIGSNESLYGHSPASFSARVRTLQNDITFISRVCYQFIIVCNIRLEKKKRLKDCKDYSIV